MTTKKQKRGPQLNIRLKPEERARLLSRARAERRDISGLVKAVVFSYLDGVPPPKPLSLPSAELSERGQAIGEAITLLDGADPALADALVLLAARSADDPASAVPLRRVLLALGGGSSQGRDTTDGRRAGAAKGKRQ